METIHTGWLIKSPAERPWKLLKSKWRKRFFALCVSQASTALPGQCMAIFDYYDNDRLSHKRGSIDLNNCEEVLPNVCSPPYPHVFSLRMKHRDHYRKYMLAADTEDDMNRWVQCLCTVLQLGNESETNTDSTMSLPSSIASVVDERYVMVPQMPAVPQSQSGYNASLHPSPVALLPGEFELTSTLTDEDTADAYIPLDQCYSGTSSVLQRTNHVSPPLAISSDQSYMNLNQSQPKSDPRGAEYRNVDKMEPRGSGEIATIKEPVVISGRSPNFKRNVTHSDIPLPIKKCDQGEDTSSSEDDASDDNNSTYRSCEDRMGFDDAPPIPLPPKKNAHTNARMKDAIHYLDLNLEDSGGGEKSPFITRSAQHLASAETNYNEIDWVKTKALLETRKGLESERHNSEKSSE